MGPQVSPVVRPLLASVIPTAGDWGVLSGGAAPEGPSAKVPACCPRLGTMRIPAVAFLLVSAFATAVMVAVLGLGVVGGAVYSPDGLMVPAVPPPPVVPLIFQVTAVLVLFATL